MKLSTGMAVDPVVNSLETRNLEETTQPETTTNFEPTVSISISGREFGEPQNTVEIQRPRLSLTR